MLKLGKNLLIIGGASIGLVFLAFYLLGLYTGGNDNNIQVPDVVDMRIDKAKKLLEESELRYEIIDSVYSEVHKRMAITEQNPAAGSQVKTNRKIYIVLNSMAKPMVKMPQLVNSSLNLAKVLLNNSGLKLGEVTEISSEIGHGFVIQQLFDKDSIPAQQLIEKGSKIDLWVSKKLETELEGIDGESSLESPLTED